MSDTSSTYFSGESTGEVRRSVTAGCAWVILDETGEPTELEALAFEDGATGTRCGQSHRVASRGE